MTDQAREPTRPRWPNNAPTVPTLAQQRELRDILEWVCYEAPAIETLLDLTVDIRLVDMLLRNKIRSFDQLYPAYTVLKKQHGSEPMDDVDWDDYYRVLSDELQMLTPEQAGQIVIAYENWAAAAPEQAALIVANSARRPLPWRARQIASSFLRDGVRVGDLARTYGITRTRVDEVLRQAGLHTDLRQLHRMNLAWETKWAIARHSKAT